jgi:hypothetical protein
MTYTSARFTNEGRTSIIVTTSDGRELCVPVEPTNRHYQEVVAQGVVVDDPVPGP